MPTWLDDNSIEGEMSQEEFIKTVMETMTARVEKETKEGYPGNYGNDGLVVIYEETKQQNSITYKLKALRYFAIRRLPYEHFELQPERGMNKIGKHIVVESDGVEPSYDLKRLLGLDEFLFHDSLHSGQEDWTLRQQWEEMDRWAQLDCERVNSLSSEFDQKVKDLQKELLKFIKAIKQ